ncbi:hypothetical protein ABGB18_31760 [Nonomuraea sp. B12E4]|uniref:hypothetical protein n=1 Tax=Nonomuraea sp. B12E4 TaxID=3153564 RepID=UPI00325EC02A
MTSRDAMPALDQVTRQRLGPPIIDCAGGGRAGLRTLLFAMGVMVAGSALLGVSPSLPFRAVAMVAMVLGLALLIVGVGLIFAGARQALRGAEHYYLHTGGLVYVRRGRAATTTWSEVRSVTRRRPTGPAPAAGITMTSVLGYEIATRSGARFHLKVGDFAGDERSRFCFLLEELATRAGARVRG